MTADDMGMVVQRVLDAWANAARTGDGTIFDSVYAPEHIEHSGGADATLEETRASAPIIHGIFGDPEFVIHEQVIQGDRVATRYTLHFTHRGTWQGVAETNKRVTMDGMSFDRVLDDKVVESWVISDVGGTLKQLNEA